MRKLNVCEYCKKEIILLYPSWPRKYHLVCYKKIRKGKQTNTGKTHFKKGQIPWNFIDGTSKNRFYMLEEWKEIAKKCYKRDKYMCRSCGKKGGVLNAHHMIPYSISKDNRLINLITLCVPCHAKEHNNFKDINKQRKEKAQEVKQLNA